MPVLYHLFTNYIRSRLLIKLLKSGKLLRYGMLFMVVKFLFNTYNKKKKAHAIK